MKAREKLIHDRLIKQELICSKCLYAGWLTAKQISVLTGLTSMQVALTIRFIIKNKESCQFNVFVDVKYSGGDQQYRISSEKTDFVSNSRVRKSEENMKELKQEICDLFCGKGWFMAHEVSEKLSMSNKKAGGLLQVMRKYGFFEYVISQKLLEVSGNPRAWMITKRSNVKPILCRKWV